mgnify:CR=1 FL=1
MKLNMKTLFALFVLTLIIAVAPINADTDAELKGRITASNNRVLNDARQDLIQNREEYGLTKDDIDGIMQQCENLVDYSTNLFWQYYNANTNLYITNPTNDIVTDISGCAMQWPIVETGNININEETIQLPDGTIDYKRRAPFWLLGTSCAIQAAQAEQACLKACMGGQCITNPNVWECQLKCSQVGLEVFLSCIGLSRQTTTTSV